MTDRYGRSYSVTVTPSRSFGYPSSRRNTVVGVANEFDPTHDSRNQETSADIYRRSSFETAPIIKMSKVVRSVKNVTKGYSSVQVKVRNGKQGLELAACATALMLSDSYL